MGFAFCSAVMAWLEQRADQSATAVERIRAAELLVALAEGGLFRPLVYVRWLVAHGILPGTGDRTVAGDDRRSWHRCGLE